MKKYDSMEQFEAKLKAPFPAEDIEWRLQQAGESTSGIWALALPYITNRGVMDRLDDVFGVDGWRNGFAQWMEAGVLCQLECEVLLPDPVKPLDAEGQVVYRLHKIVKSDGAANTGVIVDGKPDYDTNIKGGLSGSMKRCAVQLGIGRDLYAWPTFFLSERDGTISQDRQGNAGWTKAKHHGKSKDTVFWWHAPEIPAELLPAVTS